MSQQPQPATSKGQQALVNRIELEGPPGHRIVANFAGMKFVTGSQGCKELSNGIVQIVLDGTGTASLSVEVTW